MSIRERSGAPNASIPMPTASWSSQLTLRHAVVLLISALVFGLISYQALELDPSMSLSLDMSLDITQPSRGQVFWDINLGYMREQDSVSFDVQPDRHLYTVRIPVDACALRIDPVATAGSIRIHRIGLSAHWSAVRHWDSTNGFALWRPMRDLRDISVAKEALCMKSTGGDPALEIRELGNLRDYRRTANRLQALMVGLLLGVLNTALLHLFAWYRRPRSNVLNDSGFSSRTAPTSHLRINGRNLMLLAASILLCAVIGYVTYQRFIAHRVPPGAPIADSGYALTMVDRQGNPLVETPGDLKLVLDPFTIFRNFPGQKTSRFTINLNGYRESKPFVPSRPIVAVLGASLTFGLGLAGDADTFVSRLNSMNPDYAFVNAGVAAFLSGQELSEMIHYADRLSPRMYIVVDGWNEQYCQLFPDLQDTGFGYNWQSLTHLENRLRSHLAGKGPLAGPMESLGPREKLSGEPLQEKIFAAYSANLWKMFDFSRARGASFLIAFQPQLGNKRQRTDPEEQAWTDWEAAYSGTHAGFVGLYNNMVARSRRFCEAHGIAYADLNGSPVFRDYPGTLFLDAVHLNAEGHLLVAELLQQTLQQPDMRRKPDSQELSPKERKPDHE